MGEVGADLEQADVQEGEGKGTTGTEIDSEESPPDDPPSASPFRRCLLTGAIKPKREMIRFVLDPEGEVVPDVEECLPGRGFWLSCAREALDPARLRRPFNKTARRAVVIPTDLPERTESILERRCLNLLGLARRAGLLVTGFEKVCAALKQGQLRQGRRSETKKTTGNSSTSSLAAFVMAVDGSDHGWQDVRSLVGKLPVVRMFSADAQGAALGRGRAVHLVLAEGRLTELFLAETERLRRFRTNAGL